jgi:hypothetical protein
MESSQQEITIGSLIKQRNGKQVTLILIAFFVMLLLHIWSLMRYPAPHVDEAWLISRAWEFVRTGHAFGMLDSGLTEQFDHYWIGNQWFITALHSLVLRFFPAPMLLPMRAFSMFVGGGLLIVNYIIANRLLKTRRQAAGSTLLLATSLAFFHSAHQVRYDILAVFLIYSALALVLTDRDGRPWIGLLAGLLTGLAVETHLNCLVFIPVVGVCYLFQYGRQVWKKGTCWGYAAGCLAGLVYYLELHYFPNPATYRLLAPLYFGQIHTPPLFTWQPAIIAQGLAETGNLLLVSAGPMVILALLAIPGLVAKREKETSLIFVVNIFLILLVALIYPNKFGHYGIYIAPFFLLMVTFYLSEFLKRPWPGNVWGYIERIVVWGAVAGAVALNLVNLSTDQYSSFQKNQARISSVIKPTDVVIGPQNYWFGLYTHRYLSWETLFLYPRLHPGASIADSFENLKPDIFILDAGILNLTSDTVDPSSKWYSYHLPEGDLMEYLNQHSELVLDSKLEDDSTIKIYRIRH